MANYEGTMGFPIKPSGSGSGSSEITTDKVITKYSPQIDFNGQDYTYDSEAIKFEGYSAFTNSSNRTIYIPIEESSIQEGTSYSGNVYEYYNGVLQNCGGANIIVKIPQATKLSDDLETLKKGTINFYEIQQSSFYGKTLAEVFTEIIGDNLETFSTNEWFGIVKANGYYYLCNIKDYFYGSHSFEVSIINVSELKTQFYSGNGDIPTNLLFMEGGSFLHGKSQHCYEITSENYSDPIDCSSPFMPNLSTWYFDIVDVEGNFNIKLSFGVHCIFDIADEVKDLLTCIGDFESNVKIEISKENITKIYVLRNGNVYYIRPKTK